MFSSGVIAFQLPSGGSRGIEGFQAPVVVGVVLAGVSDEYWPVPRFSM